jgi:hypothetical protein
MSDHQSITDQIISQLIPSAKEKEDFLRSKLIPGTDTSLPENREVYLLIFQAVCSKMMIELRKSDAIAEVEANEFVFSRMKRG